MITRRAVLLVLPLAFASVPALRANAPGEPAPTLDAEVQYLLGVVAGSGCHFYRNGTWYDSKLAASHLRRKYSYLVEHRQVLTTEQFIERAATTSSVSGKPYLLQCTSGQAVPAGTWLRDALSRYRQAQVPKLPAAGRRD